MATRSNEADPNGATLSGSWTGRYDYADPAHGDPVAFDTVLTQTGTILRGETIEPNTFCDNAGDTLMAVLTGTRRGSHVRFKKTYTDFESDADPAYYGQVNGTATRITGRWHFPDAPHVHGTFLMARTGQAAVRAPARAAATING
jgi:hypothetical protein